MNTINPMQVSSYPPITGYRPQQLSSVTAQQTAPAATIDIAPIITSILPIMMIGMMMKMISSVMNGKSPKKKKDRASDQQTASDTESES